MTEREVLELHRGAPIEAVRSELGEPLSEATEGDRTVLHYYGWRLAFSGGELESKVRIRRSERPGDMAGRDLDLEVQRLRPGMSPEAVEARLGAPSTYEEAFDEDAVSEEVLRYGPWEISFAAGALVRRTKY